MRQLFYVIGGFIFLISAGCVADKTPVLSNVSSTAFVAEYRDRALSLEDQGEVQQAIFAWQVIRSVRPKDPEAQTKLATLQTLARQKAAEHYEQAKRLVEKGDWQSAVHQAVISLRYDPAHVESLALINKERDLIQHQVQPGESLAVVAGKHFNDPAKAPIIAYFNDLSSETAPLAQGTVLVFPKLPKLDVVQPKSPAPEMEALLAQARQKFKKKKYYETVVLAEKIIQESLYEQETQLLLDQSYLALGKQHLKKREYGKADEVLGKISEGFPGRKETLVELRQQQQKLAEEHYRQGVKYYLNEKLTEAIREWKLALQFYPDHTRARENIEKTQKILDKLQTVH